nr:hypothetical protein [uncultured Faecalicatena sp.]
MKFNGEYFPVLQVNGLVQHEKNKSTVLDFLLFFHDFEKLLIQITGEKADFGHMKGKKI